MVPGAEESPEVAGKGTLWDLNPDLTSQHMVYGLSKGTW